MKRRLLSGAAAILLFVGLSAVLAWAAEPVILTADQDSYLIGLHLDIFDDPKRIHTIEEVSSPSWSDRFRPSKQNVPNFGLASSAHWLRFTVENKAGEERAWLLEVQAATVDHVDLYARDSSGRFHRFSAGDAVPMKEWEIRYRYPTFPLRIPPGETRTFFLRLESTGLIRAWLVIACEKEFLAQEFRSSVLFALFAGGVAIVILYNLMFWVTLRERIYLYYVLSTLSIGLLLAVFTGTAYQYLWPDSPAWGNISLVVSGGLLLFWTALFTREFLKSEEYAPYLDYLARFVAATGLMVAALSLFAYRLAIVIILFSLAAGVVAFFLIAIKGLVRGHRYAVYYLASYLVFFLGLAHAFLALLGIIPVTGLGMDGMAVGLPITLLVLSLAMADRFMHLQRQYSASLEQDVAKRTEQLDNALDALAKSHDLLEQKVEERTAELAASNQRLRREIDERERAERMLEEAHFRLEESARDCFISEQRFRTVFEAAQDCMFLKDTDLNYVLANPYMLGFLGETPESIVTKTDFDLFGDDYAKHAKDLEKRVLEDHTVESEHLITVRGWSYTFNCVRFPVRDRSENVVGLCGIGRDVTERRQREGSPPGHHLAYLAQAMAKTVLLIDRVCRTDSLVLFLGESGSGKDYWARHLHDRSERAGGPFMAINCAALPTELVESELFGHEAGAFTGAVARKRGLLELVDGGTALLNEIGDMPLSVQAKLLTFLDSHSFTRLGGQKPTHVNTRILAATNRDLKAMVERGLFREDLFHRLNVFTVRIPPLRERKEDLVMLAQELIEMLGESLGLSVVPNIDPLAADTLLRYDWPGNVRELRNVLERALIIGDQRTIKPADLADLSHTTGHAEGLVKPEEMSFTIRISEGVSIQDAVQSARQFFVSQALARFDHNVSAAARFLGVSRATMRHYLKSFGLD